MNNIIMKSEMDTKKLMVVQSEFDRKKKQEGIMYLLWWFTGIFGGHRFYLGDSGMGIGMLLTLGGLGFWVFIDLFLIGSRLEQKNNEIERDIIMQINR